MSEPDSRAGTRLAEWWSPAGISAIVATLTLVGGAVAGLFNAIFRPEPPAPTAEPSLFVYGSWEPNGAHWDRISGLVDDYSEDAVDGSLYDSGRGYAFATFGGRGTVPGVLLEFSDTESFGDATDALAQFGTDQFDRVEVETESGRTATAYEWAGSAEGFPPIGHWEESLEDYGRETAVNKLALGDCFDASSTAGMGTTVNCHAPHQFEVYHRDEFIDPVFPGLEALETTAYAECSRMSEVHLGRPFDPTSAQVVYPSEATWAQGDRAFVCAAVP